MSGEASMIVSIRARDPSVPECSASTRPSMVRKVPIEWANMSTPSFRVWVTTRVTSFSRARATSALFRS